MSERSGAASAAGNGSSPDASTTAELDRAPAGSGAVAWETAERVARWVGNRSRPSEPDDPAQLERDFEELTAQAEELVAEATGLRSASGPARAR
ncbi:MAG TPA: hypothetical protein VEJ44_03495, partial [Acidimicrobiales bacterium]|nr:hypothetical protein [Acidimicrobiales bacterium]